MIVYYGRHSTTDGKEYLIGYEEGNEDTGNVIVEEINGKDEDCDDWIYQPDTLKQIKKGEKEIKEGKKIPLKTMDFRLNNPYYKE